MRRLLQLLVFVLGIALGPAAARAQPLSPDGADTAQQVLVLLRMTPEHFHPNLEYGGAYGAGPAQVARQRTAARLARDYGLKAAGGWPMPLLGLDCIVLAVPSGASPDEAAERISNDPRVAWAEPMKLFHGQSSALTHNDPLYLAQPAAVEWRLAQLHGFATGRGVRVAVIDSAVETTHPDLAGQVAISEDFVIGRPGRAEDHGTGVAGIIAAVADNHLGIAGVAPGAKLLALRACWQRNAAGPTVCDTLSLAKAIYFAITHDAQVVNLSLSGPPDPLLSELLKTALARGVTVVSAVDRSAPRGGFPASQTGVVAVAQEEDPPFPGAYAAPGRDIPTTQPGGRWAMVTGSSYAAAHVSGLFALLRERGSRGPASPALVTWPASGGRIDACASLSRGAPVCDCACRRAAN